MCVCVSMSVHAMHAMVWYGSVRHGMMVWSGRAVCRYVWRHVSMYVNHNMSQYGCNHQGVLQVHVHVPSLSACLPEALPCGDILIPEASRGF